MTMDIPRKAMKQAQPKCRVRQEKHETTQDTPNTIWLYEKCGRGEISASENKGVRI